MDFLFSVDGLTSNAIVIGIAFFSQLAITETLVSYRKNMQAEVGPECLADIILIRRSFKWRFLKQLLVSYTLLLLTLEIFFH